MRKYLTFTLILIALLLCACGLQLPAEQVANVVYEPQETTDFYPVQTTGNVYIREVVNDEVVGSLESDTYLWVVCDGSWCYISGTIYKVFQGCVTYNPDGLGCQAE